MGLLKGFCGSGARVLRVSSSSIFMAMLAMSLGIGPQSLPTSSGSFSQGSYLSHQPPKTKTKHEQRQVLTVDSVSADGKAPFQLERTCNSLSHGAVGGAGNAQRHLHNKTSPPGRNGQRTQDPVRQAQYWWEAPCKCGCGAGAKILRVSNEFRQANGLTGVTTSVPAPKVSLPK